jgi:MOSC domain-containing protein YiiM
MDERCVDCGFGSEDYTGNYDATWLESAVVSRAQLIFESLEPGSSVAGHKGSDSLAAELSSFVAKGDLHEAVHRCHLAAAESNALFFEGGLDTVGRVAQINTSGGGVPKLPVTTAEVTWRGISGDRHREYKHHGHAWQALSLWSSEVIGALQEEGHPIAPGLAGENLTLSGLEWQKMRTGLVLQVGKDLVCELTGPAVPCKKNRDWFLAGDFRRMSHTKHPGWSRWYAAVLAPGSISQGDEVRLGLPVLSS